MAFDNLEYMSPRDRAGIQHHEKLFNLSGAPGAPNSGKEFGQVIAEAAGLDADGALAARESDGFFGSDGFGFDDFLDLINPLQHIPIISTIYREITGDTISDGARIFGGALFGGPLGFAAAVGNAAVKQASGKDVGELAMSLFDSDSPAEAVASAEYSPVRPWRDPDAGLLSGIAPAAGSPTPSVSDAALNEMTVSPASGEEQAGITLNPPGLSPKGLDYLDRMNAQQKALLLSSLGLPPEKAEQPEPRKVENKAAERAAALESATPERAATPDPLLVRTSAKADDLPLIGNRMDWPESTVPPGIDPSSPDWIAKAMTQALDKYDQSFGAVRDRGDRLDSKI